MKKINLFTLIQKVKQVNKIIKYYLAVGICLTPGFAFSENSITNSITKNSIIQNSKINTTQPDNAKEWDLTENEWNQYIKLMQGPAARYYKKLTPPQILGVYSETSEDMRRFAELSAKQEHDKLERELRFNVAFHEAAARLYASEEIIKPFEIRPFTPIPKIKP